MCRGIAGSSCRLNQCENAAVCEQQGGFAPHPRNTAIHVRVAFQHVMGRLELKIESNQTAVLAFGLLLPALQPVLPKDQTPDWTTQQIKNKQKHKPRV